MDLFDVSPRVAPLIEPGSIYQLLHHLGPALLRDADFAHLYCPNNGRPSWWHDLRQSRYIGRRKTQLQALLTAVVINLKTLGDRLLDAALGTRPVPGTAV